MSKNWIEDISGMHENFGFHEKLRTMPIENLNKYLRFRADFLQEELTELNDAIDNQDPEEIVDALIDLCVVAIGTLDVFEIDGHKAWDAVLEANMSKKAGVKESRPNPLGLPDLMKSIGWIPPNHDGNHGRLTEMLTDKK